MEYFNHDTMASHDDKIMALRMECGGAAIDAYWYFVEYMHREMRPLDLGNATAMRVHSHVLCVDEDTLRAWVEKMVELGLFHTDEENQFRVFSKRAVENFSAYAARKEKASESAKSRWEKPRSSGKKKKAMRTHDEQECDRTTSENATALRPHDKQECDRNANKNKIKESIAINSNAIPFASGDAAAAKAAPPAARKNPGKPICPLCYEPLSRHGPVLHCDHCGDDFEDGKAAWI